MPFSEWESFYVIIGSSAAALTGLQFVVIALVADKEAPSTTHEIDAFATPTIVHFCVVLFLSGVLTSPWHGLAAPALLLGVCSLAGLLYSALVLRRARRQTAYHLVFEDWLFFILLPLLTYGILAASAWTLAAHPEPALFGVATTVMLLLFIGIHNARDAVTFIAVSKREQEQQRQAAAKAKKSQTPPAKSP